MVGPPSLGLSDAWLSPLPSGVTGISVTQATSPSGHFFLLGLVLGMAGTGLPLQPMAQHAELWGRCTPAAALRFWGTGTVPRLCVLGALLAAAAERKHRCQSNPPRSFWPRPISILSLSSPPSVSPTDLVDSWCQASAFLYQLCLLVLSLWVSAVAGHRENQAPGVSEDRLSPVLSWDAQILLL